MAIFHLTHSFVRRNNGTSSIATAAYNSGQKLYDNKGQDSYLDYSRKGGVLHNEISLPAASPGWAQDRGELWRRLEAREDRSTRANDAILASNFNIALPHELTLEQNIFLARDYVREQFIRKGYVADWSIHSADPRGDARNIHLHILVPLRKIEGESFSNKQRYNRSQLRQQLLAWRSAWAELVNRHMKRYGHGGSIDERSLKMQGVRRQPGRHRGPQPRSSKAGLDRLRALQPALPLAPCFHNKTRQISSSGTTIISTRVMNASLNQLIVPLLKPIAQTPTGWPPEAIRAWLAWGKSNPEQFFRIWQSLAPAHKTLPGGPS